MRTRFDYIRALIPLQAKSAATMLALGCDEIVMGLHSELGPIDPQIIIPLPGGGRYQPAHAILRDFQRAKAEMAQDISALAAWTPILNAYAGGLLDFCTQQIKLSQATVAGWLEKYMLTHPDVSISEDTRGDVARSIAEHFGSEESYDRLRSHSRPTRVTDIESVHGLRVRRFEADHDLQDSLLSLYHLLDFSFGGGAVKIVENHLNSRYVRVRQQIILQAQVPGQQQQTQPQQSQPKPIPQPAHRKAKRRRR